jgi:hypothetical protein
MNSPTPSDPVPPSQEAEHEARMRACLELRREMEELHARLQYLRLLIKLGVGGL